MSLDFGAHLVYGVLVPAEKLEAFYAKLSEPMADAFHEAVMNVAVEVGDGDQVIGFHLSSIDVREQEVDDLGESLPSATNPAELKQKVYEALRGAAPCKHCKYGADNHRTVGTGLKLRLKCRKKGNKVYTPAPPNKADNAIEQLIAYLDKEPFHYLLLGTVT